SYICSYPSAPSAPPLPYTTLFRSYRASTLPHVDTHAGQRLAAHSVVDEPADHTRSVVVQRRIGREREVEQKRTGRRDGGHRPLRSEEHTSELQSHLNLVCRLLLEK